VVRAVPHSRRRPCDDVLRQHPNDRVAAASGAVLDSLAGLLQVPVVGLQQEMAGCQHQRQRWFHDLRHRQRAQYREVQAVRSARRMIREQRAAGVARHIKRVDPAGQSRPFRCSCCLLKHRARPRHPAAHHPDHVHTHS